jgi:hypothetical protein
VDDARDAQLAPLIQWLQVASTYDIARALPKQQVNQNRAPANTIGKLYLPPIDEELLLQRSAIVDNDLPFRRATTETTQASHLQTLLLSINLLDQQQSKNNQQLHAHVSELRSFTVTQFRIMDTDMTRLLPQPARQLAGARPGAGGGVVHTPADYQDPYAKLANHPRTLLLLWHEYLYGLAGNKPAKNFTSFERGKVKFKYCQRKVFWAIMVKLINAGFTEVSAIDKIHQAYGISLPVSAILSKMQTDRKNGGHPKLSELFTSHFNRYRFFNN